MLKFPSILENIEDLNKDQIDALMHRTLDFELNKPTKLPIHKKISIVTSFLENSTRTKLSFAMAIKNLGGHYIDFNMEASSLKKGESLEQTFLTLYYQGINLCILRTSESHLLKQFKKRPPIKIINAGDGTNQHPTQALLDLYTLKKLFKNLKNITLAIIGDCKHSRVAHSLFKLLPEYGINIILAGPSEFMPKDQKFKQVDSIDEAILQSDALYMLRIQNERHEEKAYSFQGSDYHQKWGINKNRFQSLAKKIPVLHPGPANIDVEVDQEIVDSELWTAHKQVENSVFMRMAIIELMILNKDQNIGAPYNIL